MANQEHLDLLKQDVAAWNRWRKKHPDIEADLSGATLRGANLSGADLSSATLSSATLRRADLSSATLIRATLSSADLSGADLSSANLSGADLRGADLRGAYLSGANLSQAYLSGANLSGANLSTADLSSAHLSGADLSGANLSGADLSQADLSSADLSSADLRRAILVGTNFTHANLSDCQIYGISAWDVHLEEATQFNLVITPLGQPTITVDNLKVAQFIYLLLNNQEIREVITTISQKVVLILGRFTPQQKGVLDALRKTLRPQLSACGRRF